MGGLEGSRNCIFSEEKGLKCGLFGSKTTENEGLSVKKASIHQQNWVCFAKKHFAASGAYPLC
jgi:hypothetical protein